MLPQCSEVGQGQPADPPRPVSAADPDERPGGLQGKDCQGNYDWIVSISLDNYPNTPFDFSYWETIFCYHAPLGGGVRTQCQL